MIVLKLTMTFKFLWCSNENFFDQSFHATMRNLQKIVKPDFPQMSDRRHKSYVNKASFILEFHAYELLVRTLKSFFFNTLLSIIVNVKSYNSFSHSNGLCLNSNKAAMFLFLFVKQTDAEDCFILH